jgi:cell division protein FtsW
LRNILNNIEGDRAIWALVTILAILSFLPVYSASTNLVYVVNNGTTTFHLFKHAFLLVCGFLIIYAVHKVPYRYFSGGSVLMIPIVIILLFYTLTQGTVIGGANASRWIQIPFIGIGFQTSTLAGLVLMVYVARYLAKNKDTKKITFRETALQLWLPVAAILILILPANFSTTAIVFCMILLLSFIGGYPLKYIASVVGIGVLSLALFVLVAKAFPDAMPNRVDTWMNRIENFSSKNVEEGYQVEKAKIAIASGGLHGRGPGKSIQKNFLPQSSSDFIFAIIVEEYGLIGAVIVILLYLFLLFRIVMAAKQAKSIFATLLIIGVGLPIIFQALINMAVAVNLFPVTGQTLPLISSGGTSIWMTCIAVGMILSVTADKEKKERIDNEENPLDILHEAIG